MTRRPSRSAAFFYAKRIFANHLPPYLACRSDSDAASRPSAGGGFVKPTRSKRSAQTRRNKRACARRPGKRACEAPAKNQAPSDWGGDSPPPGWRVGSTPWRIRLARPDPRFASSGGKEERNGTETWERRLSDFVGSVAGPSERRGEIGAGEESREKREEKKRKGRKKYVGPDGAKRKKKRRTKAGATGALRRRGGGKKEAMRLLFFLHFASAPRGA